MTIAKQRNQTAPAFDWSYRRDDGSFVLRGRLEMTKDLDAIYYAAAMTDCAVRVEAGKEPERITQCLCPTVAFLDASAETLKDDVAEFLSHAKEFSTLRSKLGVELHVFMESLDIETSFNGDRFGHPLSGQEA